ncbi:MAG: hypothetical protein UT24_C0022G0017 [Candidatus Woesebacteria bacterium GW2011_GWB1_39_12]|uniref:Uncharacterized protein n=1 Tax=Candidatus Woesebacteria bacterium GW2011_GWB1_39_12 TaxID=1618574 RepID=A0A0G0QDW2_9BACT|nr:MAG: hypothetical protein UT24_C0022G0017 [Candidatus Woesebacteria bacterium GW2011_GWB1_39_12]
MKLLLGIFLFLIVCGCTTTSEPQQVEIAEKHSIYVARVENLITKKVQFIQCDGVRIDEQSFILYEYKGANSFFSMAGETKEVVASFSFNDYSYSLIANEEKK